MSGVFTQTAFDELSKEEAKITRNLIRKQSEKAGISAEELAEKSEVLSWTYGKENAGRGRDDMDPGGHAERINDRGPSGKGQGRIIGPGGRRFWPPEQKAAIIAEAMAKGADVREVADRHGVKIHLLQKWLHVERGHRDTDRQQHARQRRRSALPKEAFGASAPTPIPPKAMPTPAASVGHPERMGDRGDISKREDEWYPVRIGGFRIEISPRMPPQVLDALVQSIMRAARAMGE